MPNRRLKRRSRRLCHTFHSNRFYDMIGRHRAPLLKEFFAMLQVVNGDAKDEVMNFTQQLYCVTCVHSQAVLPSESRHDAAQCLLRCYVA